MSHRFGSVGKSHSPAFDRRIFRSALQCFVSDLRISNPDAQAVMDVGMKERRVAGWDENVENAHRLILEFESVPRLLFNRDGRLRRRARRRQPANKCRADRDPVNVVSPHFDEEAARFHGLACATQSIREQERRRDIAGLPAGAAPSIRGSVPVPAVSLRIPAGLAGRTGARFLHRGDSARC
jgi:hypothetical protein